MAQIEREPCYIYSMREYQEHSLILEAISLNLGAIAILARGAKRPDSPLQGLFQPFTPLLLSLQLGQKGDLYYLKDYEYCPGGYHFVIPESFCAFYLNELLHLLYHGKESDKLLFGHYIATLEAIEHKDNIEHHLRSFELHLLKSLGYAISPLDEQGEPVKADQSYRFCFGIGFVEVDPEFMAQVMRTQSQKTTAAPAPVPQPETGADNAMLFAKSKIRGPKMAESRPSQAPGQEAWVKRALEQGFSSSVIQRYYEYGADLLGPILTGAEIQDIVSLECKLPHSAHNAKLLTASVINRLTGGVELNSRKLYREYLHLCKQKQAAAQAPAPTAPKAAPAPAPAVATAATPAPTQVVAPMAPAPQPAASAVAAPAPSTVPTKPQVTAPVASAAPEVNPAPVASLETVEPMVETEQVAGADESQSSQDETVVASPELETEAISSLETSATTAESESEAYVEPEANQAPEASLETSATATEGESEVPVEPEANPVPVTSLETAEPAVETEQGAGAEVAQENQDEIVAASPELETEATSSLETSATAFEGESEGPVETEANPEPEASLETAEPAVEAEQGADADMAQASQDETVAASPESETEATSSLETSSTAAEGESEAPAEPEANPAPEASLETAEPKVEAEQGASAEVAQVSQDEIIEASTDTETKVTPSLESSATTSEGESEASVEPEANPMPVASLENDSAVEVEQGAGADTAQASQDVPEASLETNATASNGESEASVEPETNPVPVTSLETAEPMVEVEQVAGAEVAQVSQDEISATATDGESEASVEPTAKAKKVTKNVKAASAKGRKTSSSQTTAAKRKSKKTDLATESDPAVPTVAPEEAQAQASEAHAKPKRSTKAKSVKSSKTKTTSKGSKASTKRSARQRAAEPAVKGADEVAESGEPEPEVAASGPELEALDDELLILAPQEIEPEAPVKVKKVKKLTKAQLKAKAKAEAEARIAAEQERMATSPYDESMLMTLDASLNRRRRKKPAVKQ